VTVTMPVHPLVGRKLRVVRWMRRDGGRYVEVEFPPGRGLRLPGHWVDGSCEGECESGRPRLSAVALLRLASLIDGKIDERDEGAIVRCDGGRGGRKRRQREGRTDRHDSRSGLVAADPGTEVDGAGAPGLDAAADNARERGRGKGRSR